MSSHPIEHFLATVLTQAREDESTQAVFL